MNRNEIRYDDKEIRMISPESMIEGANSNYLLQKSKINSVDVCTNEKKEGNDFSSVCRPVQIVSIGSEEEGYSFNFHEERFENVLREVPPRCKVCIISVVGAFRTGKSFLLSWFLRYLSYHSNIDNRHHNFMKNDLNSRFDRKKKWYDLFHCVGNQSGFHWRGGAKKDTTGIWIWSHPFLLNKTNFDTGENEEISVLLMDTQGMFDHDSTMKLTSSIFGLSTLLSSYLIYNVDKRIQEDNLQHLALFSEYGRVMLQSNGVVKESYVKENYSSEDKSSHSKCSSASSRYSGNASFQKVEFLIRDWQNFENERDFIACEQEMEEYLENVLAERTVSDLRNTREQIRSCFNSVTCYMMTHPGFSVTNKNFSGEVKSIDPTFLEFLDRYCERVFGAGANLIPKAILGREVTAIELIAYIKAYTKIFEDGAHFPEASTMLDATVNANNANAISLTLNFYKDEMEKVAGVRCSDYLHQDEFNIIHENAYNDSMNMFDEIANFGSQTSINMARDEVQRAITDSFEIYSKLNNSRNPLLGFQIYIMPILIAFFFHSAALGYEFNVYGLVLHV